MPTFDIIRGNTPKKSFRVDSIIGTYDLQTSHITEHFKGNIDLPEKWNIGLIVGRSGTGKSTIAKELFGDYISGDYTWEHDNILDDFPKNVEIKDITYALTSVGFSSPPSWLKPYNVLSNGEKMRVNVARAMLSTDDLFVFDEFTSVVDRNVAQISSFAIQKAIRRKNKRFIAVTCHYDVENWLMPDWIFNTDTMTFSLVDEETQKKNRPAINIEIREIKKGKDEVWRIFSKYHYLSYSFNKSARTFVAYVNGELAGFTSVLPFVHPKKKDYMREHRTVVLPDYQGVGIGREIRNKIASYFKSVGKGYITTSSSPSIIYASRDNTKWIMTRHGRASIGSENGKIQNKHKKGSTSSNRVTCSWEYVGE